VGRWRQSATGVLWWRPGDGEVFCPVGPLRGGGYLAEVRLRAQGGYSNRQAWGVVLSASGEGTASAFESGESLLHRSMWGQFHGQPGSFNFWTPAGGAEVRLPVWRRIDTGARWVIMGTDASPLTYEWGVVITAEVVSEV
jgi:hypothetical protein